jgi:hypothetical protein
MKGSLKVSSNRPKNTLDDTFRYLYAFLIYREVPILAIEFRYLGTTWRVDTPQEAVALRNELEKSDRVVAQAEKYWTADRFMGVIESVGKLQAKMLVAIRRQPGITSAELVTALGMKSEVALAGVISGLSKQLKKLEIDPNDVFLIKVDWSGKSKTRSFILDDFFIGAGIQHNWPDAWEKPEILPERSVNAASTSSTRK